VSCVERLELGFHFGLPFLNQLIVTVEARGPDCGKLAPAEENFCVLLLVVHEDAPDRLFVLPYLVFCCDNGLELRVRTVVLDVVLARTPTGVEQARAPRDRERFVRKVGKAGDVDAVVVWDANDLAHCAGES